MKLTRYTNYAIRMLMYCDSKNGLSTISEIANFYNLSEKFLGKILISLTKHGYIETVRGRNGGITLSKPATQIFIGDLVRTMEEKFELAECFQDETSCPLIQSCTLNKALSKALNSFFSVLNEYTLADLTMKNNAIYYLLHDIENHSM